MIVAALPSSSLPKYTAIRRTRNYFLPTLQSALVTLNPSKSFFNGSRRGWRSCSSIDQKKLVTQVLGASGRRWPPRCTRKG